MARIYFNVTPRYTPGSSASVPEDVAKRVAAEERRSIDLDLSGVHGAEAKAAAELLGLGPQIDRRGVRRGIAEEVVEHRDHWMVRDLLTGEVYQRPFPASKTSQRRCDRCLAAKELQSAVAALANRGRVVEGRQTVDAVVEPVDTSRMVRRFVMTSTSELEPAASPVLELEPAAYDYFDRLRRESIFHDMAQIVPRCVEVQRDEDVVRAELPDGLVAPEPDLVCDSSFEDSSSGDS